MQQKNIRIKDARGYGTVDKWVILNPEITTNAKALYSLLSVYAGGSDSSFPSISLICHQLNLSKGTVSKALNELKNSNVVLVEQEKENGKFARNIYTLLPYSVSVSTVHQNTVHGATEHGGLDTKINSSTINSIKEYITSSKMTCNVPYSQIMEIYNHTCGDSLNKARLMSDKRKRSLKKTWDLLLNTKDDKGNVRFSDAETSLKFFNAYFIKLIAHKWWAGEDPNSNGWKADFDFAINPNNVSKIIEWQPNKDYTPTTAFIKYKQKLAMENNNE